MGWAATFNQRAAILIESHFPAKPQYSVGAETHLALMQSEALDCRDLSLPLREGRRPTVCQTRQCHACVTTAVFHSELPHEWEKKAETRWIDQKKYI